MTPLRTMRSAALPALLALAATGAAHAADGWDEALQGELSGDGLAPSALTVSSGLNTVRGSTGRPFEGGPVDRDYFSFTVPAGHVLDAIVVLPGTVALFDGSFIGLMTGAQFTVPPDTQSADGLLGWALFGENQIGEDLLPGMSFPLFGSSGFTVPLPAGPYALWVQETGVGVASYGLGFNVSAVPEAPTALALLAGLAALSARVRRQRPGAPGR